MQKATCGFIGLFFLLAIPLAGMAGAGVEIPMTTVYMNTHPTVINAWEPWFKEVAQKTGGELRIVYYNPNTLCPLGDNYDSTISGMVGVGGNDCARTPGKFPLSSVLELPGLASSAECGSLVMWELYRNHPEIQKSFKEIKLLWMWASAPFQLHMVKNPVRTFEDLKGQKIIVWNRASVNILNALGANPIQIPPTDSYLALERGMADGVFCPLAPIVSFKISEAVKYTTVCDMFVTPFWGGIGYDIWNSLSKNAQSVLIETTGAEMAKKSGYTLDQGDHADSSALKAQGHSFYVLPNSEKARWLKATETLREAWVREMEGKGFTNARKVMEDAYRLSESYTSVTGMKVSQ